LIIKDKEFSWDKFKGLFPVALIGAMNPILLFIALQFTAASFSPLIYGAVPAMTALYILFFTSKNVSTRRIIGILIGLIGVGITVVVPVIEGNMEGVSIGGNLLILLAALAFTGYGIMSNSKQKDLGISPLALTFYFSLVTLILSIPFAGFEIISDFPVNAGIPALLSTIYVGLVGTGIFYLAYQYAINKGNEITASLFTYLQPVFSVLMAVVILGDQVSIFFGIGGVLAIIGAQLSSK
jgi:drug/metabolite transporter (DMT)-like permease